MTVYHNPNIQWVNLVQVSEEVYKANNKEKYLLYNFTTSEGKTKTWKYQYVLLHKLVVRVIPQDCMWQAH